MDRVIIQSRMSSSRLPGKAMLPLGGLPMTVLVALRAANTGLQTIVATSADESDDVLAETLAAHGIDVVRGPLDDPLERFRLAAADLDDADVVVRLTADNVVPDGDLVQELLDARTGEYARIGPGVPYGLSAECFTVRMLRAATAEATDAADREHVTPWIRTHAGDQVVMPDPAVGGRGVRCTVDTQADYERAARTVDDLDDPVGASWRLMLGAWPNRIGQGRWLLGTVQLGLPYGVARAVPDERAARRVLEAAVAESVTHVDTARAYGVSEARVGAAWRGGVITKIRPLDEGDGGGAVRGSLAESLGALDRPAVSAVLVHRWADWARPGVADALVDARDAGRTTIVGASVSTPAELLEALLVPDIEYVQLPFNLVDRRWLEPDIQAALSERSDVVVAVRSVLLQGLLAVDASRWPTVPGVDAETMVERIAAAVGATGRDGAADLCVAYAMSHPFVSSLVLGADDERQVHELAAMVRREPLDPDQLELVRGIVPAGNPGLIDPSTWRWP